MAKKNPNPGEDARGADTRAALLAAGRSVFSRKGFDGASVRDITREAGANLGAITYHFGSKRGLYEAVLTQGLTPLADMVAQAAVAPGPPVERLEGVVEVFVEYLGVNQDLPGLILQEVAAGKHPPEVVLAILRRNATNIAAIARAGWEDGTIRETHPVFCALSVISQPIFMTVMAPLLEEVGGLDLSDAATRRMATEHMQAFIKNGLSVRQEASE